MHAPRGMRIQPLGPPRELLVGTKRCAKRAYAACSISHSLLTAPWSAGGDRVVSRSDSELVRTVPLPQRRPGFLLEYHTVPCSTLSARVPAVDTARWLRPPFSRADAADFRFPSCSRLPRVADCPRLGSVALRGWRCCRCLRLACGSLSSSRRRGGRSSASSVHGASE